MTLWEVWTWARERDVSVAQFRHAYTKSLFVAIGSLLQAMWREHAREWMRISQDDVSGEQILTIGAGHVLSAPVRLIDYFNRLDLCGWPTTSGPSLAVTAATAPLFAAALRRVSPGTPIESVVVEMIDDFHNSFANLVLNRLLLALRDSDGLKVEARCTGHAYYPFPGLRIGPLPADVETFSNLSGPAALPVYLAPSLVFRSRTFRSASTCYHAWSGELGSEADAMAIPVHPWQLTGSPEIQTLVRDSVIVPIGEVRVLPLTSQRTVRVDATGYDLKLPVNVTLTGEHRLLYGMNRANAIATSALVSSLIGGFGLSGIGVQRDLAVIEHPDPRVATQLSAIVRQPVRPGEGETLVPALAFWEADQVEDRLSNIPAGGSVQAFFEYCMAVMDGPISAFCRCGVGFEPHLQNSLLLVRHGKIAQLVLRDMDATIMDLDRVADICRAESIEFAEGTEQSMPDVWAGGRRLAHALIFGHLSVAVDVLSRSTGHHPAVFTVCIEEAWASLVGRMSGEEKRSAEWLRAQKIAKPMLKTRLARQMVLA